MLTANQSVVKNLGSLVLGRLGFTRNLEELPDNMPGWLRIAVILAQYFAPAPAWGSDYDIVGLIKQAVIDCKKAIKTNPDSEFIPELEELLTTFRTFLLHNGLAEPE